MEDRGKEVDFIIGSYFGLYLHTSKVTGEGYREGKFSDFSISSMTALCFGILSLLYAMQIWWFLLLVLY